MEMRGNNANGSRTEKRKFAYYLCDRDNTKVLPIYINKKA